MRICVTGGALAARLASALGARHTVEAIAEAALVGRLARGGCELVVIDAAVDAHAAERLARAARAAHRAVPVLVVTAPGDVEARVRALEAGADDSLAEPWAASQMAARVGALGRRAALVPEEAERVEADGCTIDLGRAEAWRDGRRVALTAREVAVVRWLWRHAGRAVARAELLEHVWGVAPGVETRSVDVAIAELRKKLERPGGAPRVIVSVRGVGYGWGPGLT